MNSFTLNWFGMAVHDVPAAADFYGSKLGFRFWQKEDKHLWAFFETRRMTFELFKAHAGRIDVKGWGYGQAYRPAILVNDLSAAVTLLQNQGVLLSHEVSEFEPQIEMTGPEGIRWSLLDDPDSATDWEHPVIGGIALKAANLQAQINFYTQILGMTISRPIDQGAHLTQPNGEAWLHIQAGGAPASVPAALNSPKPAFFFPIWISFETTDIHQAHAWLRQSHVSILRPITYHQDWEGTDVIIADVDGNAIQLVQYGKPEPGTGEINSNND